MSSVSGQPRSISACQISLFDKLQATEIWAGWLTKDTLSWVSFIFAQIKKPPYGDHRKKERGLPDTAEASVQLRRI